MKPEHAREILQSLIQGVDPLTGAELPAGTALHQAEVLRALLAGVAALEDHAAREARRLLRPRNVGQNWGAEEQSELIQAFQSGRPLADIANKHGRTLRGIESRLQVLGLISAGQRTTIDRFAPKRSGSKANRAAKRVKK